MATSSEFRPEQYEYVSSASEFPFAVAGGGEGVVPSALGLSSDLSDESSVPESWETATAACCCCCSCCDSTGFVSPTVMGDSCPEVDEDEEEGDSAFFFGITESSLKPEGGSGI